MKKRVMQRVLNAKNAQKTAAQAAAQAKMSAAFSIPEISAAHARYTSMLFDNLKKEGDGSSDELDSAYNKYLRALKRYNYSEADFSPAPVCPLCGDTGISGGKPCGCVWNAYIDELKKECKLDLKAPFSFKDCSPAKIKDEKQRRELEKLYSTMRRYCAKFPNVNFYNIVLSGGVGTGKTCLASAVSRAFAEKGNSVMILSSYEFNSLMLTCHTSHITERNGIIHDALCCDLLAIDDLGTEPMLRNVTTEYLLLTLEERLNKRLVTLITTNLSTEQLLTRYGERIYSRLSDKKHSLVLQLNGDDLRQL